LRRCYHHRRDVKKEYIAFKPTAYRQRQGRIAETGANQHPPGTNTLAGVKGPGRGNIVTKNVRILRGNGTSVKSHFQKDYGLAGDVLDRYFNYRPTGIIYRFSVLVP